MRLSWPRDKTNPILNVVFGTGKSTLLLAHPDYWECDVLQSGCLRM